MERTSPVSLRISNAGLQLVTDFEGAILHAYDDADPTHAPVKANEDGTPAKPIHGTLTIGSGHTSGVFPGQQITEGERLIMLRGDLRDAERYVHQFVKVPLHQHEFDALTSIIFNVGPGRVRGSLGANDPGKSGIITLANGEPSSLLRELNKGNYRLASEWFTAWKATKGFEYGLFRRRIAEMLLFLGLPWKRALNACKSLAFTIADAIRLATEEANDLEVIDGPDSTLILTDVKKPSVGDASPVQPVPEASAHPKDDAEAVRSAPFAPKPSAQAPASDSSPSQSDPAPSHVQLVPPGAEEAQASLQPPSPGGKSLQAPAPPRNPPPSIGQQTSAVDGAENSADWSSHCKNMVLSRRFWGLFLVMTGRLWMLKTGSTAYLTAVSDPLVTEMVSGFGVMLAGEVLQWWGHKKATRPLT